jgi:hypothetical protein
LREWVYRKGAKDLFILTSADTPSWFLRFYDSPEHAGDLRNYTRTFANDHTGATIADIEFLATAIEKIDGKTAKLPLSKPTTYVQSTAPTAPNNLPPHTTKLGNGPAFQSSTYRKQICEDFLRGSCDQGLHCRYRHEKSTSVSEASSIARNQSHVEWLVAQVKALMVSDIDGFFDLLSRIWMKVIRSEKSSKSSNWERQCLLRKQ